MSNQKQLAGVNRKDSKCSQRKKQRTCVTSVGKDNIWTVERIVDRRLGVTGQWEYLLKWKGYSDKYNSWEPESHLATQSLIELAKKQYPDVPVRTENVTVEIEPEDQNVFDQLHGGCADSGYTEFMRHDVGNRVEETGENNEIPEAVVYSGIHHATGQKCFGVTWKGSQMLTLVSDQEAKTKFPELVFQYYERCYGWPYTFC